MDFFISDALAQTGQQAPGNPLFQILPFVLIFVVLYFLMIRPQQKRMKEHKQMMAALGKGDEVVTNGGLLGKITEVGDSFVTVELASNVNVKVQKNMVANVMPKGTLKQADKDNKVTEKNDKK